MKEEEQVLKRYTERNVEKDYEYGPKQWPINPNLTGVQYTGKTGWR